MHATWKRTGIAAMVMGLSILVLGTGALAEEKPAEAKTESAQQDAKDQEAKKEDDKKAAEKALEWFKRIKFSGDLRYRNELIAAFNDELLNYAVYKTQSEKNKNLRELILQRVLLTNNPGYLMSPPKIEKVIEDPDGILKTWEEMHGTSKKDK